MVSREDKNRAAGFMYQGSTQERRYVAGKGGEDLPRHLFLPTRAGHSTDDAQRNGGVHMTEKRHATVVRLDTYREKWVASLNGIQCRPPVSYDRRSVNLHRVSETMRAGLVMEPVNFLKSAKVPDKAGDARCCSRHCRSF